MNKNATDELKNSITMARVIILERASTALKEVSCEAHVFGSVARNDADPYSDLDVWFTINDAEYLEIFENRFHYYEKLGKVIHSCEAPQNAPIGGVHTALIIETDSGVLTMVDIYLCPRSTSYKTTESRKLFGEDIPLGEIGFNPQKIQVDENYRIDFFICFVFNTIKKLVRNLENPLEPVIKQYKNLYENYGMALEPLPDEAQNIITLQKIIKNVQGVAIDRQKIALEVILKFSETVLGK